MQFCANCEKGEGRPEKGDRKPEKGNRKNRKTEWTIPSPFSCLRFSLSLLRSSVSLFRSPVSLLLFPYFYVLQFFNAANGSTNTLACNSLSIINNPCPSPLIIFRLKRICSALASSSTCSSTYHCKKLLVA